LNQLTLWPQLLREEITRIVAFDISLQELRFNYQTMSDEIKTKATNDRVAKYLAGVWVENSSLSIAEPIMSRVSQMIKDFRPQEALVNFDAPNLIKFHYAVNLPDISGNFISH